MSNKFVKLAYFAYRNLFRNARRTLFTLMIAASSFAAMGIAAGYYCYSIFGIQELTIRNGFSGSGGTAHLQIEDVRKFNEDEKYPFEFGIDNYKDLAAYISKNDMVDYVIPRIEVGGIISNGETSLPFIGYGVEPELESRLRDGLVSVNPVLKGNSGVLKLKNSEYGVILGQRLAKSLKANIGDTLMLYGTTADAGVNAIDVVVTNIISTGITEADKYYMLTTIETAQRLANTSKVSLLAVMLKDRDSLNDSAGAFDKYLQLYKTQQLGFRDWVFLGEYYKSVRDLFRMIFAFMGYIIIVIAILSCWNITNMATMERIREIGALRAIGLKNRYITSVFVMEGFLISIVGVVLGFILQLGLVAIINYLQISMPPIPGMNLGYFLRVYQYTDYHFALAIAVIVAISLSGLSSFFTIRKLSIVESLDHV